jgi:hypothetical protein
MTILIPRIRGRAFQYGASWMWEIFITIGEDSEAITLRSPQIYLNQDSALVGLKAAVPDIIDEIGKALGLPKCEAVMDLKSGTLEATEEWVKKKL